MMTIEEIREGATNLLDQIGADWIQKRMDPDTIFIVVSPQDEGKTETYLNYLILNGYVERVVYPWSAWKLTKEGKMRVIQNLPKTPTSNSKMPILLSPIFYESAANLIKLGDAFRTDPNLEKPESVKLVSRDERLWPGLNNTERRLLEDLWADLLYLREEKPYSESRAPNGSLEAHFSQAKDDNDLLEMARLLYDCPKLATGVEGANTRQLLWRALGLKEVANRFEALQTKITLRLSFRALRDSWKKDAQVLSAIDLNHKAYQKVIQMGMPVVPIILEELRDNPDWWGPALQAITKENPCTEEMEGKLDLITQAWLDWGRARGHI